MPGSRLKIEFVNLWGSAGARTQIHEKNEFSVVGRGPLGIPVFVSLLVSQLLATQT